MLRSRLQARFLFGMLTAILAMSTMASANAQSRSLEFKVVALAEENSIHRPFVDAAKTWLAKEAAADNFSIDYLHNTAKIDEAFLSGYHLFLQLDYPPYMWTAKAATAFQNYVEKGKGHGPVFEFLVPDVQTAKRRLVAAGCTIQEENASIPRSYIRDPYGVVFNISQARHEK